MSEFMPHLAPMVVLLFLGLWPFVVGQDAVIGEDFLERFPAEFHPKLRVHRQCEEGIGLPRGEVGVR